MRKSIFILLLAFSYITSLENIYAQHKPRVGVVTSFMKESVYYETIGFGLMGEFSLAKRLSFVPQLIFYSPQQDNIIEVNLNANYYFLEKSTIQLYGMGGLNITQESYEDTDLGESEFTSLYANMGVGSNFKIGKTLVPFVEFRYTTGVWFERFVLALGMKFNLN